MQSLTPVILNLPMFEINTLHIIIKTLVEYFPQHESLINDQIKVVLFVNRQLQVAR